MACIKFLGIFLIPIFLFALEGKVISVTDGDTIKILTSKTATNQSKAIRYRRTREKVALRYSRKTIFGGSSCWQNLANRGTWQR